MSHIPTYKKNRAKLLSQTILFHLYFNVWDRKEFIFGIFLRWFDNNGKFWWSKQADGPKTRMGNFHLKI